MARRWLARVTNRLVPSSWRHAVQADLDEEAATDRRGRLWVAIQAASTGIRLRRFAIGDAMRTDLRYAGRSLARSPGYTIAAMLTFALGIGANIAVFSVIDRMMFRPLPYGDAGRLVHLHAFVQSDGFPESSLLVATTIALRERARSFDGVATARTPEDKLTIEGLAEPVRFAAASHNLLRVLEVAPIAGRDFAPTDVGAAERPILLADEVWSERFDRSPGVFDLALSLGSSRQPLRVVGILPASFMVPSSSRADRIDGLILTQDNFSGTGGFAELGPSAVARLRPGTSIEEAQAEVDVVVSQLVAENPDSRIVGQGVHVMPIRAGLFYHYQSYAWLIVAGVGLVLLVACVNLATLLLAKGRAREHDVAIRTALGAAPWRILRLTLLESAVLCGASAAIALVVCQVVFTAVLSVVPAGLRGVAVDPLDVRLVGLALGVSVLGGLVAAAFPAIRAARIDVLDSLRQDGRSVAARLRGGGTLMIIEAALGVLLVAGAATTVANYGGMVYGVPGFDEKDLYGVRVQHGYERSTGHRYDAERVRRVVEILRAVPNVESAAAINLMTLGMERRGNDAFWKARGQEGHVAGIGEGYFGTVGTPVLAGREFSAAEVGAGELVVMVSQRAAAQLWPGVPASKAVGDIVEFDGEPRVVVGVVDDVVPAPGEAPMAGLYLPITARGAPESGSAFAMAVRMAPGVPANARAIDDLLDEAFGAQNSRVESIAERAAPFLQRPRFQAVLFASLAGIALMLSAVGLYAVAAFDVTRRRREMGVRLTLGATARDLRRAVIGSAVRPVLIGATAGLGATWWAAQYFQSFLFQVDARDFRMYALVAVVLIATAVVAAWLPARRAARTDPASVLRTV